MKDALKKYLLTELHTSDKKELILMNFENALTQKKKASYRS